MRQLFAESMWILDNMLIIDLPGYQSDLSMNTVQFKTSFIYAVILK